jgi:hypothetical protein
MHLHLTVHARAAIAVAAVGGLLVAAGAAASADPGANLRQVERVSRTPAGPAPDSGSDLPSISSNGRFVVFDSAASNLTPNDTNGTTDVFLFDRMTGTTTLISRNTAGDSADQPSLDPAISSSGTFVVYTSYATDIGGGSGTPAGALVYRYNVATHTTTLVSKTPNGSYPAKDAGLADVSATGRYVAYYSAARNLVTGDTNNKPDVFLYDSATDTTTLVSMASDGTGANGMSSAPTVSKSGRWVAYQSKATNIVPSTGPNFGTDVYLWDRTTGTSSLVTESTAGGPAHGSSFRPDISDNGRYVGFDSLASDLVADTLPPGSQAYVYDRVSDTMTRISTEYDDWPGGSSNTFVTVADHGQAASYLSDRWDSDPGDVLAPNVLVWDRSNERSTFASTALDGSPGDNTSSVPSISADGNHVAFTSLARNLPHGVDQNHDYDTYVWNRLP